MEGFVIWGALWLLLMTSRSYEHCFGNENIDHDTDSTSIQHLDFNLSHIQISQRKHYVLVLTDVGSNYTTFKSARYRCISISDLFCTINWKPIPDCITPLKNGSNSFARYVCTLQGFFIFGSQFEVQVDIQVCNTTFQRSLNFTIAHEGLKPMASLQGRKSAASEITLRWKDADFPSVVWEVDQAKIKKIVHVQYWAENDTERKSSKFYQLALQEMQALVPNLERFTTYCFKATYRITFGTRIQLSWARWSDQYCITTLGVPSQSIHSGRCVVGSNETARAVKLEWKFPSPDTWNGMLTKIKLTIISRTFTSSWELPTTNFCTNCSTSSRVILPCKTLDVPQIEASLCTKGGCGSKKVVQCLLLQEPYRKQKRDDTTLLIGGVVLLIFVALGIAGIFICIKRFKSKKKRTLMTFGELGIIEPRPDGCENAQSRPNSYSNIAVVKET